jgi:anaerobic ribonucleoside-triphosphate reductase
MYLPVSYDQEFDDLFMYLKGKYPKKLFDLDGIGDQLDLSKFSKEFFSSKTTADISVDDNANVDDISVIAYVKELPKPFFRINSYYMLWKELRRLYGKGIANDIVDMQLSGDIYINDFHGLGSGISYCFNYSTYDIMMEGLPMINKITSTAPNHLYSFKSQIEQFTIIAANSTLGATGLADLLIIMSYYVKKILDTKEDAHFKFKTDEDAWTYIKENLVSLIYTLNQPTRGNQCLSDDTKILTENGWKSYNEIMLGDNIYTMNLNNNRLESKKVLNMFIKDYEGEMYNLKNRIQDQLISPEHKVVRKVFNTKDNYVLEPIEDVYKLKSPQIIPIGCDNDEPDYDITDNELRLVSWIVSEGSVSKDYRLTISQSKIENPNYYYEIKELLNTLNYTYSELVVKTGLGNDTNIFRLIKSDSLKIIKELFDNKGIKFIPDWIGKLSQRQARIFLDTYLQADGNISSNTIVTTVPEVLDNLEILCVKAGYGFSSKPKNIEHNKLSKKPQYQIRILKHRDTYIQKIEKVNYNGKIWCPTTVNGTVIAKRNGKVFITGNSCFTNVSIYDNAFLDHLIPDYLFPDGSTPDKDIIKKLQELLLVVLNEELKRTPITFPIVTACFSIDKENNIQDEEFARFIAKYNKEYGFINIYCGTSSTLSSCCFHPDTPILAKSSNGVKWMSFKDYHALNWEKDKKNTTIFHNGSWCKGNSLKLPYGRKLYNIQTSNNKEILVTDDHIHPTIEGDKPTTELTENDYLLFNSLPLNTFPEKDMKLTYEQGYLIGLYLGDGSKYKNVKYESYTNTLSMGLNDYDIIPIVRKALDDWGITTQIRANEVDYNVLSIQVCSKVLFDIINEWVYGNYAHTKELNMQCIIQSLKFREGILDGWYKSDGGNSNRIYTTSKKLSECGELLITSIGKQSIINIEDRTNEKIVIRGEVYNRNYPSICVRWYDSKNKRSMSGVYKVKNNSIYYKIKSIKKLDEIQDEVYCFEMKNEEEPYFTLPNGIITHNCRLRSDTNNEYFNSFGSGSSKIGSLGVVTINLPRLAIKYKYDEEKFFSKLRDMVKVCSQVNNVKRKLVQKRIDNGNHPLYSLGFISLGTQYSTVGLNGLNEAVNILGYDLLDEKGQSVAVNIMNTINDENDKYQKQYNSPHNCEQVPGESLSVKLADKDKLLKYQDTYDIYSNQFIPLTTNSDMLDRIYLQGKFDKHFSGGSICHINVESKVDNEDYIVELIKSSAKMGVIYFALNYNLQRCVNGHLTVGTKDKCSVCNGDIVDNYTRVVGFLTNTKNWNKTRREVDYPNRKWYSEVE